MSKKEKTLKTKETLLGLEVNIHKLKGGGEMIIFPKVLDVKNSEKVVRKLHERKVSEKDFDFKIIPSVNAGKIKGYITYN